ncbi:MAG: DUF1294 domain-containing protein [Bacteroidaceae bacterium]|nr:DUF1294 domain-containing protein [Bacteroidaceae bacterium]MBR1788762.1 DUF1294 domain-containing protein [Bacteroidaceae bacterium]
MTVVTFIVFGIDKWKAAHERWRVPESTLFLLAAFGGSLGALLGMQVWRHKTQHWTFRLGIPLIFVLQVGLLLWLVYGPQP